MLPTIAAALTLTVAITAYAASRGRSPVLWGGASVSIFVIATLLMWISMQRLGSTDAVFDRGGGALGMLAALVGPIVAIVGNGALASRLLSLPKVRPDTGSSWLMWSLGDADAEAPCRLTLSPGGIVGTRGAEVSFSIPYDQLIAVEVDGEALRLRAADGRELRLMLADGDPNDRNAQIDVVVGIKRKIERAAQP